MDITAQMGVSIGILMTEIIMEDSTVATMTATIIRGRDRDVCRLKGNSS